MKIRTIEGKKIEFFSLWELVEAGVHWELVQRFERTNGQERFEVIEKMEPAEYDLYNPLGGYTYLTISTSIGKGSEIKFAVTIKNKDEVTQELKAGSSFLVLNLGSIFNSMQLIEDKGFGNKDVQSFTGLTKMQVIHATQTGIIESREGASGRGSRRKYSKTNLAEFLIYRELNKFRLEIQFIGKILRWLRTENLTKDPHVRNWSFR